ncbi:MAG: hypothetical protein V8T86_07900 [Victivallis sp.]
MLLRTLVQALPDPDRPRSPNISGTRRRHRPCWLRREGRLDGKALLAALKQYDGPALIRIRTADAEDGLRRSLRFL